MKLPITDAFLWELYTFFEEADKGYDLLSPPRSFSQILHPEMHHLRKEYERRKARTAFSQFLNRLVQNGYIKVKALEGAKGIMLTPKGAGRVLQAKRKLKGKEKKKRKDGRWIMIIFDIPEKRKGARDLLRGALLDLGYEMLQQSVWMCAYDVWKETEEAVREYRLILYVQIFLIEELT